MRIGILTLLGVPNYGAVLQAFALQTHLLKHGHDAFFIDYQYGMARDHGVKKWIGRNPSSTMTKIHRQLLRRPFISFENMCLRHGPKKYNSYLELMSQPPVADVYVTGSDQVWNPKYLTLDDERTYWLDFGSADVKRISYAASFGVSSLNDGIMARYSKYAKNIDSIGVREKSGLDLMKKLGRNDAIWVPDPTLLLSSDEYTKIIDRKMKQTPSYVFNYVLGSENDSTAAKLTNKVSTLFNTACYMAYSKSLLDTLLCNGYKGPAMWLERLKNSTYVVTNSFHATIFSLLFHRPFLVILRAGDDAGMNDRVVSVLSAAGLGHRIISNYDESQVTELCHKKIDWQDVDTRLEVFRRTGFEFIAKSLL